MTAIRRRYTRSCSGMIDGVPDARDELQRIWDEHAVAPFPTSIDKNDERWDEFVVHPVMMDADLAGAILGVLKGSTGPTETQRKYLTDGLRELAVTWHLVPNEARPYFARLQRMAELALDP